MSLINVIQPWIKQFLSDHVLNSTVEVVVKQLEVWQEINIPQVSHYLNQFVSQHSSHIFQQLATELKDYVPDVDVSLNAADLKKKKKELRKLMRSLRSCENIKQEGNSASPEKDINNVTDDDGQFSDTAESLLPMSSSESVRTDTTRTTQGNGSSISTLQLKPLHKLISASNAYHVWTNDQGISDTASNVSLITSNSASANTSVPERKKHKKKKKSKDKERNMNASLPVINCSAEQVPEACAVPKTDNLSNPDCLTEMFLKLLDFVKSLGEGPKKKITEDIFNAISNSIKENCTPPESNEDNAGFSDVCKTKSKKKKRKKSRDCEVIQPKEIIYLDITEDHDSTEAVVEKSKKHKSKKKDKRRESPAEEAESAETAQEFEAIGSVDASEDTVCEIISRKKKKKKRHREISSSFGGEFEEGVMHTELGEEISEHYEEPPKKKKKKDKSKRKDSVEEAEIRAPESYSVPQEGEVVGSDTFNKRRHTVSVSRIESHKTNQEVITSPTDISLSKKSSQSNGFEPTLCDFENLISESVINRRPRTRSVDDSDLYYFDVTGNQSSGGPSHESGTKPNSDHQTASSNSRPNQEENVRSSPTKAVSPVQLRSQESSILSTRIVISNPFPSFELGSYESTGESDSSVEIVDHILEKIKTEPLSPSLENNSVTPERQPVTESRKQVSKNSAPNCIPSEVPDESELDDKDNLHEIVNIPDCIGNEFQHETASRVGTSSDVREQERPQVILPNSERSEVTQSNPESVGEKINENGAESAQQNQYRSLEKELLELEQCLYLADKSGGPENAKSNSTVSRESVDDMNPSCSSPGLVPSSITTEQRAEPTRSNCERGNSANTGEQKIECYKCGMKFSTRPELCQHWIKHVKEKLYMNIPGAPDSKNESKGHVANRNLPDVCPDPPVIIEQHSQVPPNSRNISTIRIVDIEAIKNRSFDSPQLQMQSTLSSSKTKQSTVNSLPIQKKFAVNSSKTKPKSTVNRPKTKKKLVVNSSKTKQIKKPSTVSSLKTKPEEGTTNGTHTSSSPLKCSVCLITFKNHAQYSNHVLKHARPFKCALCSASFKTDTTLKTHLIKHSNKKPFKCSKCATAFKRKGDLNFHLASVHSEKRFTCQLCNIKFRFRRNLLAHKQEMHQPGPSSRQ